MWRKLGMGPHATEPQCFLHLHWLCALTMVGVDMGERQAATHVDPVDGRDGQPAVRMQLGAPKQEIGRSLDLGMPRRDASHHHHVFVVELSDRVWNEASFRKVNPGWRLGNPFVYVGMTGLDPELRFDRQKANSQAS